MFCFRFCSQKQIFSYVWKKLYTKNYFLLIFTFLKFEQKKYFCFISKTKLSSSIYTVLTRICALPSCIKAHSNKHPPPPPLALRNGSKNNFQVTLLYRVLLRVRPMGGGTFRPIFGVKNWKMAILAFKLKWGGGKLMFFGLYKWRKVATTMLEDLKELF